MYDVTRRETFSNVEDWLSEVRDFAPEEAVIYLIGNKADAADREVEPLKAIEFVKRHKLHKIFETSAMTGESVDDVFKCAAEDIVE